MPDVRPGYLAHSHRQDAAWLGPPFVCRGEVLVSFKAKYKGVCESCEESVHVGQEVEYTYNGRLVHASYCPESLDALGAPRPVCPRCFTEIAVIGTCGCDPE